MSETIFRDCILIVESDLVVRQPLGEYLRECGFKVIEAVDTDEATTILNDGAVPIDIILCDVNSSGQLDGFGLSQWVKENNLPAKVILAGSVERAARKAGDLCENGPLLSKPYHHGTLFDRIKRMLAQRERNTQHRQ
jgi:DNA-binding response OmpR family regulator